MAVKSRAETVSVYDPRGRVESEPMPSAARVTTLAGLRLGVLDNSKWNAGALLRGIVERMRAEESLGTVTLYRKESFSKNAPPELIEEIARDNDIVVTAIGD